jgi:hypothetical protein
MMVLMRFDDIGEIADYMNCEFPGDDECHEPITAILLKECDNCGDNESYAYCTWHAVLIADMSLGCMSCREPLPPIRYPVRVVEAP